MTSIRNIAGIGEDEVNRFAEVGIRSVEKLLAAGTTPAARAALAERTGIDPARLLTWINHADLFRVKGVAGQYAELLEVVGVDTVVELGNRNPANLHAALGAANHGSRKLVRQVPGPDAIVAWVEQAASLDRIVTY